MAADRFILSGRIVRLVPLEPGHADALAAASGASDAELYRWSFVPQGAPEGAKYIAAALASQQAGTAVPLAIVRVADETVIGSSRFFDIERWAWPEGHSRHGRTDPDVCEIGYTWFSPAAIRTGANTETKLLMLAHAFEVWQVLRVCLHTDARNQRSRAAIERIGGRFEGILRAHRMAADFTPRDSARYSIVAAEWPETKERLMRLLARPSDASS